MAYQNPEAGKILGYIYDNRETPTWQRSVHEGQSDDGTYYRWSGVPDLSVTQHDPAAKKIPLYQPFFQSSWQGRPMTQEELFSSAAIMAGAKDAPVQVAGIAPGTIQSHMFSPEVRKGLGLPNSFDMFRGVDPTKPDWGASKWTLFNPTSSGFFGDIIQDLGPFLRPLDALGLPPALQTAIKIAIAVASGGTSAAAEAGTEIAGEMVAQEFAQQAMEQALADVFSGTAVNAAAAAATTAVAEGGIGSLINSIQGLGSTISKEVTDTLGGMGIKGIAADAVKNAGVSAAKAVLTGGDPLQAAISGAVTTGVVGSTSDLLKGVDPSISKTITSAVSGATQAALGGGDIGMGALQGALSGALAPTGKTRQTSAGQPTAETPQDIDEQINAMIREQEPIIPMEEPISTEDIISRLESQDEEQQTLANLLKPAVEIMPVTPPEEIPVAETPEPEQDNFEQFLAGLDASAPTATEDWIDRAGLYEQPQTMDDFINALLVKDASAATPSEDWIDAGRLISKPLEIEIAGAPAPLDYATPSEEWIDKGGLGFGMEYATPTESFIDQGGLGFGPESSTPTESFIDQGGLGGAPAGTGTMPSGGSSGGRGTSAPAPSKPSTTDKLVQQLTGQQQPKSNMSDLMAMLGIMGASQQRAAPPPIPVVGEIEPYQFSTDLLEGLYPKPRMAQGGSINDLMRIVRG